MPGELTSPATWRCIALDDSKREKLIQAGNSGERVTLGDLDGRELKFLKDNRPRRRYLYFRFIISYLNARKLGFSDVAAKIGKRPFWPSGGDYLNRSTLRTLARYVSGADIPESLVEANTFDHPDDPTRATEAGMVIGAAMEHHGARGPDPRAAVAESMSRLEIRD